MIVEQNKELPCVLYTFVLMHSIHCSNPALYLFKYVLCVCVCLSSQRLLMNTKEKHQITFYPADGCMTHLFLLYLDHLRFKELKK